MPVAINRFFFSTVKRSKEQTTVGIEFLSAFKLSLLLLGEDCSSEAVGQGAGTKLYITNYSHR